MSYLYGVKIQILVVGKTRSAELTALIDDYVRRIQRYIPIEISVIPDVKAKRKELREQLCIREGKKILEQLKSGDAFYLLDERGAAYTSPRFAQLFQKKMNSGKKRWVLAIGGPFGFSKEVYERADGMIRLSEMTFPHELVRLFLVEQLYRACTILRGEPYHHE